MNTLAHRVLRQHGFLVALASGLLVLAVSIVQSALNAAIGQLCFLGTSGVPASQWWAGYATQFAFTAVPLALGVVLSFWFIAPIGPDLHIAHVITRAALAAAVGSVLVFLVNLATSGISVVTNGLMGQIRLTANAGDQLLQALGFSATIAAEQLVTVAPLVILAGVLLRMWLARHPSEYAIRGIVDTA